MGCGSSSLKSVNETMDPIVPCSSNKIDQISVPEQRQGVISLHRLLEITETKSY